LWLHNNRENNGYANLLSPNLLQIGGAEPHTQWVFYLRMWTDKEKLFVNEKIVQVQKDHPNAPGQIPFVKLEEILKYLQANCVKAGSDLDCVEDVGSNHGKTGSDGENVGLNQEKVNLDQKEKDTVLEAPSKVLVASFPDTNQQAISDRSQTTPTEVVLPIGKGRLTRCFAHNHTSTCNPTTLKIKKKI
jgi:hypothetical protein